MKKILSVIGIVLLLAACAGNRDAALRQRYEQAHQLGWAASPEKAHGEFSRLADDFHKVGDYGYEAACLYEMATNYLNQRDTLGMRRIADRMEKLCEEHPGDVSAAYSYHSVMGAYYAALYEEDGLDSTRDAMVEEVRSAIGFQERMNWEQMREQSVNPVWNYYNMAVTHDLYFDPPVRDTIEKYLALADSVNREYPHLVKHYRWQGDISIRDLWAWQYYYDGDYDRAAAQMNAVLALIDSVETVAPNTVLTERGEAYGFFVEMYSSLGDYEKALEYQQLQDDNDRIRFGTERNAAVREVEAKYNVAKVEARLARVRGFAIGLLLLALLLTGTVLYYRLLIRSREQQRYTSAVEALVEKSPKVKRLTSSVKTDRAQDIFEAAEKPLSAVERQYIMLFMSGSSTEEIAAAMNVDPSSVYTMKYRIKKKYPAGFSLPF